MEQIAQKRSSKEKGNDKMKTPEDEPSITEVARSVTELQSQMEAVNLRLDAQELVQRELSARLERVEDNISVIKLNVESISSAMGELFRQLVYTKIVQEPVSSKIQPMEAPAEKQKNGIDIEDANGVNADAAQEDVSEASGNQANAVTIQQEDLRVWHPTQRAARDSIRTPAETLMRDTVGLNTKNYGFTRGETESNTDSRRRGKKKKLKSERKRAKIYRDHGDSSSSSSSSDSSSDSSDDDTSDSSASEDSRDRRRRLRRRRTIFKVLKDQEKPQNLASNVVRAQPSFQHIHLDNILVSSILKFSDDLLRYQNANGVVLKATTLVSTKVKNAVMGKCRSIRTDAKFYEMDNATLFKRLQKLIRVQNVTQLVNELNYNVKFEYPPKNTFWSYRQFYSQFVIFTDEFKIAYEFLTQKATKLKSELKWEYKPNTVIKVFVDKLGDYGKRVCNSLSKSKFSGLNEFIVMFTELCASHRHVAEKAHVLAYSYFPDTIASARRNGHQGQPPAKDNEAPQISQISAPPVKEKPPDEEIFYDPDYVPLPEKQRRASAEESVRIYEEGFEPEPSDSEYPNAPFSEFLGDYEPVSKPKNLSAMSSADVRIMKRPAGASTPIPPKAGLGSPKEGSLNNGCFSFATTGRCDRPKCTYSHDPDSCAKLRFLLKERIKAMDAKDNDVLAEQGDPVTAISGRRA